jgi:hypothetical protein
MWLEFARRDLSRPSDTIVQRGHADTNTALAVLEPAPRSTRPIPPGVMDIRWFDSADTAGRDGYPLV